MIIDDRRRPDGHGPSLYLRDHVAVRWRTVWRMYRSYSWPGDPTLCVSATDFSFYVIVPRHLRNLSKFAHAGLSLLQNRLTPRVVGTRPLLFRSFLFCPSPTQLFIPSFIRFNSGSKAHKTTDKRNDIKAHTNIKHRKTDACMIR